MIKSPVFQAFSDPADEAGTLPPPFFPAVYTLTLIRGLRGVPGMHVPRVVVGVQ